MDTTKFFDFDPKELHGRKGLKWRRFEDDVIPMWIADTDYRIAPEIKEAIIKAVQVENLHYSDDKEVLGLMAEKINNVNGISVDSDDVYITQGVIPSMWLACRYTCKPGDEVVVTDPMYDPFFRAIENIGAKKIIWILKEENGYSFDVERLKETITPKTRLIFICNPHNPLGRVMTKKELSAIGDLAVDKDLILFSDELWEDITYNDHKHISIASLNQEVSNRTLTAYGFSKTYNIAGLQIGYLSSTNKEMMKKIKKVARGIMRGTSSVSKAVAKTIMSGEVAYYLTEELRYLHKTRRYSLQRLNEIDGIICNDLEGTYLLFPNVSKYNMSSEELSEYILKDAKVEISKGSQFGSKGEGHLRINIGTSLKVLEEAFDRIQNSLEKLK
jgi:bifunctional pyridoxal-dependent enzyme with beta-cystathionase and maltose regulon repressor activities